MKLINTFADFGFALKFLLQKSTTSKAKRILNANVLMLSMYSQSLEAEFKKRGIVIGDTIKVSSKKGEFRGMLLPRADIGDSNIIVIKLENGYNIGIRFDEGVIIEKIGGRSQKDHIESDLKFDNSLPKVAMLYTGGTIGSKLDYVTGGVYMLTKPEELLHEVPELKEIANVEVNNLMSIASEDMTYKEWQKIAEETAAALNKGAHGVVITHGTDTLHFTSAALSFMLKGLNAPVVLTGAQRSSDRGSSDAFMNLICSTRFAAYGNAAEVGVCMHGSSSDSYCDFIRGTKVRKMHTSRRDAFKPINSDPVARISYEGNIEYIGDYNVAAGRSNKVTALTKYEPKVALIKAYPNSDPEIIDFYIGKGYKGIIIEGTGLGHTPVSGRAEYSWLPHVKRATDAGVIVGMTSQCLYGRVNSRVYRNLRLLSSTGAIYCEDMLPEVAYVKLGFLIGNYGIEKAKEMLNKNMVGEITPRTKFEWYM